MKKIFGLFFILKFLLNPILANENLNIPNVFSSGGTISSSQMNSNFNYLLQKIETLQNLIASNSVTSNTPSLIATGSSGTFLGSSDGDNWFVWKSEGSGIDYSSSSFEANGKFFNSSQFYTTDFKNFLKVESFNIPKPETSSNTSYWGNLGYLGGKYYYWISNGRELYESLDLVNWTFLNLDTNNQCIQKLFLKEN